jgi:hypothetical protein
MAVTIPVASSSSHEDRHADTRLVVDGVRALMAAALIVLARVAVVLAGARPSSTTHPGENLHPPSSESVLAGMRG